MWFFLVIIDQVGDPEADHKCWERPETMSEKRPLTKITANSPGSDVAAETAAAMAAASLVYKPIDASYSSSLLGHAEQLFAFADQHRGAYTRTFPELAKYYNSTTYQDELLWASGWLFHATGNRSYLAYATGKNGEDFADLGNPRYFSWDDKRPGTQVLLSRVSFFASQGSGVADDNDGLESYKQTADAVMCILLPDSETAAFRTQGGLLYVAEWNSLQHPVASAFLAAVYGDYMLTSGKTELSCGGQSFSPADLRKFAQSQVSALSRNCSEKWLSSMSYCQNLKMRSMAGGLRAGGQPDEAELPGRVRRQLPTAGAPPRRVHPGGRRHGLRRPGVARVAGPQPERGHGSARRGPLQERLVRGRAAERDAERGHHVQQRPHRRPPLRPPLHVLRRAVLVVLIGSSIAET